MNEKFEIVRARFVKMFILFSSVLLNRFAGFENN